MNEELENQLISLREAISVLQQERGNSALREMAYRLVLKEVRSSCKVGDRAKIDEILARFK